jgi:rhamnulokinase
MAHFLAFDLGAESGRALVGTLQAGVLTLDEVSRFANEPVHVLGSLRWDIPRLWHEMKRALGQAAEVSSRLESVGVDTWGVDYALLDERGGLLENPHHYRDSRTDGMIEAVLEIVNRERLYATTGIQVLQINTLYQLFAACRLTPQIVAAADSLVTIPDLLNYWLSGQLASEYTIASTTQCLDATSRTWATGLLTELGLPARLFQPIVQPGTTLGGIEPRVSEQFCGTPVVAPACHDTASAFMCAGGNRSSAVISSGTWSLLGIELPAPILTAKARDLNFTNEGGVNGTIRFLRNIGGLWLLQACRHEWAAHGSTTDYAALLEAAADDDRLAFRSLVDPDHAGFLKPASMPASIAMYCRRTGQPEPSAPHEFTRTVLESLAFKYRYVLESLEAISGSRFKEIRIVGGGARNRVLNQFTANATGRTVTAGPIEATALGNIAMQMVATGAVGSLADARRVIERSFPVERFEPIDSDRWDTHFRRFTDYMEFTLV